MVNVKLPSNDRPTRVASVRRALRVLEAVASGDPRGIALGDLAARLGHGKGSLSKILTTLEREGFVRRNGLTGRFHLSWRLLALAFSHAQRLGVSGILVPVLQQLADETDELVQLAIADGDQLFFVAKAEGPAPQIRMVPLVGTAAPLHATSAGKAWLAALPEPRARVLLGRGRLPRLTPKTIVSRVQLLAELRQVRARRYAIVDEELVVGGRAVGAAVTSDGAVVGAVALSGPVFRLSIARLHDLAPRLRQAADTLGAAWPGDMTPTDFGLGVGKANGAARAGRLRTS